MIVLEVIRRLREQVAADIRAKEDWLGRGGAGSFEEYKLAVGEIRGLRRLDELFSGVMKKMEVEQDE